VNVVHGDAYICILRSEVGSSNDIEFLRVKCRLARRSVAQAARFDFEIQALTFKKQPTHVCAEKRIRSTIAPTYHPTRPLIHIPPTLCFEYQTRTIFPVLRLATTMHSFTLQKAQHHRMSRRPISPMSRPHPLDLHHAQYTAAPSMPITHFVAEKGRRRSRAFRFLRAALHENTMKTPRAKRTT